MQINLMQLLEFWLPFHMKTLEFTHKQKLYNAEHRDVIFTGIDPCGNAAFALDGIMPPCPFCASERSGKPIREFMEFTKIQTINPMGN